MQGYDSMLTQPVHCRPEAFRFFSEQLPVIHSTEGLLRAAIAVSMHAMDDVDPYAVEARLLEFAQQVRGRVRGRQVQAILAHLHQVLFDEAGFAGNLQQYYNPLNSYIPAVVESRRGIPVTLSLIYKFVADNAGLQVEGINSPGHFLVRVRGVRKWMIVDPFDHGTLLSDAEACTLIQRVVGQDLPPTYQCLQPATHPQWLARILGNVQQFMATADLHDDLAAMVELETLLAESLR